MAQICIPNITDSRVDHINSLAKEKGLQKSVYCRMVIYEHLNKLNKKE